MEKMKLSVVLATRNEEANLARCLNSVKQLADEIIVVDEHSIDKTRTIARKLGARVVQEKHHENFHITKQKALDLAKGEWILQLDADEAATPDLVDEIRKVIASDNQTRVNWQINDRRKRKLFKRHQQAIEKRDGPLGKKTGEVVAFFIPRQNIFLGKPLIHGGVYPDAVIRLIKNKKAGFPQKTVHEQMWIEGEVGWLENDLLHYDSPDLSRYIWRANRYTSFTASVLEERGVKRNFLNFVRYILIKPIATFFSLFIRHRAYIDGIRGFLWSIFSAWHFPLAYFKYLTHDYKSLKG